MPHQCTKCGGIFPDAAEELLKGCSCGSRFFYYIKQERLDELKKEVKETIIELNKADKEQIEKDIRELTGLDKEPEKPVILDLESVRVIKPGKFEIDLINLFSKKRPLIYKLEEGKYIIDLAASLKTNREEIDKKIRDPTNFIIRDKNVGEDIDVEELEEGNEENEIDLDEEDDEEIEDEESDNKDIDNESEELDEEIVIEDNEDLEDKNQKEVEDEDSEEKKKDKKVK